MSVWNISRVAYTYRVGRARDGVLPDLHRGAVYLSLQRDCLIQSSNTRGRSHSSLYAFSLLLPLRWR